MTLKNKKIIGFTSAGIIIAAVAAVAVIFGINSREKEAQAKKALADQNQAMELLLTQGQDLDVLLNTDTIYPGVSVMGVELGGMTKKEAVAAVEKELGSQVMSHEVIFQYGDKKWEYTFEEMGATADAASIVDRAFAVGRSGDLRQRVQIVEALQEQKEDVQVDIAFDEEKMSAVVEQMAQEVDKEAEDAVIHANGDEFTVTPEVKGLSLDQEKTKSAILKALEAGKDGETVALAVKEIEPEKTAEKLSTIKDRIGSYSTYYSSGSGRAQNLSTGASKVNGMVLMPGEVMSFNDTVAPITEENGYRDATVIVAGEYVPGLGGGLCQVSTTLYNAVIRAELEVVERDCHAYPSDYVPMGLDSTVASGYIDFKFRNDSGYPIYIAMWADGGEVNAVIYGTEIHDPSRSVSFDYVITEVIEKPKEEVTEDPTMEKGKRVVTETGSEGYAVDVYKTVTENGSSYTEWFNSSRYDATPDKVKVGTAEPAKPKPAEPAPAPAPTPTPAPTPAPQPTPEPEESTPETQEESQTPEGEAETAE